ncbi:hypothetical protein ACF0H5_020905 [Mactra antiquata]
MATCTVSLAEHLWYQCAAYFGQGTDRNNHRKFMIDHCNKDDKCSECMKPCRMIERVNVVDFHNCAEYCMVGQTECAKSCEFLYYVNKYKAGSCPPPETAVEFESVCLRSCSEDSDCVDNLRCCPNMCGHVCRKPDYSSYNLPPIPLNLSLEERRQGRALHVSWILPSTSWTAPGISVYILEQRNTTNQKPVWNDGKSSWTTVLITQSKKLLLRDIHAGYWYQYRVAMVTSSGTQGYSNFSEPFRSSRPVQRPSPPQNITEGVTTLSKGHVDLTIHWEKPAYSDLPIWKYEITWVERLNTITPKLKKLLLHEKSVHGHIHHYKLRKLEPGTTYNIKITAIVQQRTTHGKRHLKSRKTSKDITTFTPPNYQPDIDYIVKTSAVIYSNHYTVNHIDTYFVVKDLIEVKHLSVEDDVPYFDKGSLKALLSWQVDEDFKGIVKSYMIFWEPHSCDQDFTELKPYSATSDVPNFEVYDLQFECQYKINVNAVTKAGVLGEPSSVKLRTPVCERILVKGKSLPPQCPIRVPQVARQPRRIGHDIIKKNCSIDINITWKHPKSDRPIVSYLVTYENVEEMKMNKLEADGPLCKKQKPVEIRLEKTTSVLVSGLKLSREYNVKIHAVSSVGIGEPAEVKIYTPAIISCGSDKDPEPPDKRKKNKKKKTSKQPTTVFVSTQGNILTRISSTSSPAIYVTKNSTSIYRTTMQYVTINSSLNIYQTIYYLMLFIVKLMGFS